MADARPAAADMSDAALVDASVGGEGGSGLLSVTDASWLCVVWLVVWFLFNQLYGICALNRPTDLITCSALRKREAYTRRLWRSQVYCLAAVVSGVRLISRWQRLPEDMLLDFSFEHQIFFAMAVGHWTISAWEDDNGRALLGGGLDNTMLRGVRDPAELLHTAYLVHHFVAACGYFAMLRLQRCAAVGTFGLIFELPVLLMNRREIGLHAERVPAWLRNQEGVARHWSCFYSLWLVGRGGPTAVYLYSLLYWRQHLSALSSDELYLYHGMAVFFTILNCVFLNVLEAWARRDRAAVARGAGGLAEADVDVKGAGFGAEIAAAQEDSEEEEDADPKEHLNAEPLLEVPNEIFERMVGKDGARLMVAIDGSAFDLTDFLEEHPGGEQILRKFAGQDATQAFRRAGHSASAKAEMFRYMVGPLVYNSGRYRIFEHAADLLNCGFLLARTFLGLLLQTVLLGSSCYGGYAATSPGGVLLTPLAWVSGKVPQGPGTEEAVGRLARRLVLLMIMTAIGLGSFILKCFVAVRPLSCSFRENVVALSVGGYVAALLTSSASLYGEGLPGLGASFSLELTGSAVLLLEARPWAALQGGGSRGGRGRYATAAIITSWAWRGLRGPTASEATLAARLATLVGEALGPGLVALVFGASLCLLLRGGGSADNRDELAATAVHGVSLSGFYGGLLLFALLYGDPVAQRTAVALTETPGFLRCLSCATVSCVCFFVVILDGAFICSPAFISRAVAFSLVAVSGGLSGYRWLTLCAFTWYLSSLAHRNRESLKEAAWQERSISPHIIGATAMWDQFRLALGTFVWKILIIALQNVAGVLLPVEMRFYACEIPIFDLGSNVAFGVSAHYSPNQAREQKRPKHFVCNVGQIANCGRHVAAGMMDAQRTLNSLRDVWGEFQEPEMKGLVSNVICVFPRVASQGVTKEINLSAWESERDAYEWYAKSHGHQTIMKQHSSGALQTFGNLLTSAKPSVPIRHQDRCMHCMRVVEARKFGVRAPRQCGNCGGPTFHYPWF